MALEKTSNSLSNGLYTESTKLKLPDGTYSFALNALIGSKEGDAATITNENSNTICITLPDGTSLIGAVLLPNGNEVLFSTDNTMSYIHLHDTRNCTITLLVRSACLGFKTYRQIRALSRIIQGCENVIYFTDRVSSYKNINIDSLEKYLAPGFSTVDDANNDILGEGWDCVKFNHFLSYDYGCIDSIEVQNSGGSIKYGAHQFTFRYLDEDLNPTNWHPLSNPVFIYSENTDTSLDSIDGEQFGGFARKSIDLTLTDLDPDFRYVQLAVASCTTGTGQINEVYILELVAIPDGFTTVNYTYSGFNENIHSQSTINAITIPSIFVEAVQAHEQVDNRLFLANVKTFTENWALLQRATLLSEVKWFTYTDYDYSQVTLTQEHNASKNPDILYTNKTLMRDEIYALGLVFVFDNATESPVFHIPGRPPDLDYNGVDLGTYDSSGDHYYRGYDTGAQLTGQWDTFPLTVRPDAEVVDGVNNDVWVAQSCVAHIPDSAFSNCPVIPACSELVGVTITVTINASQIDVTVAGAPVTSQANIRVVRYNEELQNVFEDEILHFNGNGTQTTTGGTSNSVTDLIGLVITFADTDCSYNTITLICEDGDVIDPTAVTFDNPVPQLDIVRNYLQPKSTTHIDCEIERWKVHNTAVITSLTNDEGYMGYYEVDGITYPTSVDCDGVSVFDATSLGGDNFVGVNIRHHRMPDCALVPTGDIANSEWNYDAGTDTFTKDTLLKKLGIKLDVSNVIAAITAQDPDLASRIQGYYIVYGQRTEANKTVVDKGFAWKLYQTSEYCGISYALAPTQAYKDQFAVKYYHLNDTFTDTGLAVFREYAITGNLMPDNRGDGGAINAVDAGILYNAYSSTTEAFNNLGFREMVSEDAGNINEYVSPAVIYKNDLKLGNYVKVERPVRSRRNTAVGTGQIEEGQNYIEWTTLAQYDRFHYYGYINYVEFEGNTADNPAINTWPCELLPYRNILNGFIVPYDASSNINISLTGQSYPLYAKNGRQQSSVFETQDFFSPAFRSTTPTIACFGAANASDREYAAFNIETALGSGSTGTYVSMKNYKDVFVSLADITYLRLENCMRDIADTTPDIKGGDTFITQMRAVKTRAKRDAGSNLERAFQGHAVAFIGYVESDWVNSSLAHSERPESQYASKYFSYQFYLEFWKEDNDTFNAKVLWGDPADDDDIITYGQYQFDYNDDYGKQNQENPAFPLDVAYDYCDECAGKEPNNIYYSEKSFSADKADNYRVILANNLLPLPSDTGEITNLFLENDQLFGHTVKGLWAISTRPQEMTTNEGQVSIGTGEVGSIPPKRYVSTPLGYAGSQDPFATVSSQYGTFFIDAEVGRVFLFKGQGGINEISNAGMEHWFKDNSRLTFRDLFYDKTGIEFPNRDTADNTAVGYIAVYDPVMDRILIHKKDYNLAPGVELIELLDMGVDGQPDVVYYSLTDTDYYGLYYWDVDSSTYILTDFNNKDLFENLSWTLSYSLDQNVWVSYHSYMPNFMYSDRVTYYSFINTLDASERHVWKHMIPYKYQEFYGTRYPHVIEITENYQAIQEKVFYNLQYISESYIWDSVTKHFRKAEEITFTGFYVYNDVQCSTQRDLVVKTPNSYVDVTLPISQSIVDRTDNYWRISRFRDEVVDYTQPPITADWTVLQAYYDNEGQGYIDHVVDTSVVDATKSLYQLARFRDKSVSARLFFDVDDDYKIVTELISVLINQSKR